MYVGTGGGVEAKLARGAGLEFKPIAAGKYRRFHKLKLQHRIANLSSIGRNFTDLFRVAAGVWQSRKIIKAYDPNVVFVKGGYVGLPVGIAAGLMRYPLVIHDSDAVPGLTNRILSRWAAKLATGFPVDKYRGEPSDKLVYVGNPVRGLITKSHRLAGLKHFNFDEKKPVVLVLGGSSGAQRVNEAVLSALPELLQKVQLIHVTGEKDIERVKFETRKLEPQLVTQYRPVAFLHDEIGAALEAADIVISRAGANTLAELAQLKKPTILIPNPHLTGGHQTVNAQIMGRAGAVRVITEDRLTTQTLIREVDHLLESEAERSYLSKQIGEFAVPDADERLAKVILAAARVDEPEETGSDA